MTAAYLDRWPPHVETLRRLWTEGYSASQIASLLNKGAGSNLFTRNSVIGKLHRMGLSFREQPTRPKPVYRAPAPRKPREAAPVSLASRPQFNAPPPPAARARPVVQHSLCQWPMNEWAPGMGFTAQFCCEPTGHASSYCPAHHAKAWVPSPPRKPVGLQGYDIPRRAA